MAPVDLWRVKELNNRLNLYPYSADPVLLYSFWNISADITGPPIVLATFAAVRNLYEDPEIKTGIQCVNICK